MPVKKSAPAPTPAPAPQCINGLIPCLLSVNPRNPKGKPCFQNLIQKLTKKNGGTSKMKRRTYRKKRKRNGSSFKIKQCNNYSRRI